MASSSERSNLIEIAQQIVEAAHNEGSPVAGDAEKIAKVAVRRLLSGSRRGISPGDRDRMVQDLTKGLIQNLEQDEVLVGRLKTDYEWLAGEIIDALSSVEDDNKETGK